MDALECAAVSTIAEQKMDGLLAILDPALDVLAPWRAAAEKTSTIAPDPPPAKGGNEDIATPDPAMMKKRQLR
jgi:hypothetical protein